MAHHTTSDRQGFAGAAIFAGCSRRQLERLEQLSSQVEIEPGYHLTREGATGLEFGVIVSGTASVSVGGQHIATLGAGDHYGEMALLGWAGHQPDRSVRTATVVADSHMRVAVMSVREFTNLVTEFPDVADAIRRAARDRSGAAKH